MRSVTSAKIALFISAAIVIGFGIRRDDATIRWIGIALLVAAFALRFVKRDVKE